MSKEAEIGFQAFLLFETIINTHNEAWSHSSILHFLLFLIFFQHQLKVWTYPFPLFHLILDVTSWQFCACVCLISLIIWFLFDSSLRITINNSSLEIQFNSYIVTFTSLKTFAASSGKTGFMKHPLPISKPPITPNLGTICRNQWAHDEWEVTWNGEVWIIKLNGGSFSCWDNFISVTFSNPPRSVPCNNQ